MKFFDLFDNIFVTQTITQADCDRQAQSGYNSENNTNIEQILNVNTLYPQIDPNTVLKPSAPCEPKNP